MMLLSALTDVVAYPSQFLPSLFLPPSLLGVRLPPHGLPLLRPVGGTSVAAPARHPHLVSAPQHWTMFLLTSRLTVLARAGDTLHLPPRHHVRVPRVAVLVVTPLPGAAARGQDVEAAPLAAHVVEFLAVMTRDHRVLVLRLSLRTLRGLGHGQFQLRTHFTAGQGVRSDGFADQTRRQARTFFFVTIHCQGFFLQT